MDADACITRRVMGLAVLSLAGLAAANEEPLNAIAQLKQSGELTCQPTFPFFCGNMHVSCSGQTSLPAFAFRLRATSSQGSMEAAPETESLRKPYENARVEWDGEGMYVILRPSLSNGYIKLLADGSYSFRHYSQHGAVMSIGRCNQF